MSTSSQTKTPTLATFGGGTMMGSTASIKQGEIVFDRYELKKILGVGGMGVVWLAQDTKLDQLVALKFIPEALRHDPDAINDLKVQTKLGYKLTHNNIVRVIGFEDDEQLAAIAMEYVDGATLAAMRVDQPAQVFEADSLHVYLLHILDALEYAHEQEKIVHRDLKPANVMVNSEDRIKVADFGIACSLRNSVGRVMSMPQRSGSGTLHYMSPQQLLGGPASVSDDIYSLGAMTFELMTGTPPFHSGDVAMQIREIPAPSMTQRRAENGIMGEAIPQAWEDLVASALAKDLSLRPSNVAEFRKGLLGEPFKRGTGTGNAAANAASAASPRPTPPLNPAGATSSGATQSSGTGSQLSMTVLTASIVSLIVVGVGAYFLLTDKPVQVEKKADVIPTQRYVEQKSRADQFDKSSASIASKLSKWETLVDDLTSVNYLESAQLREIMRYAENRADYWKQKQDADRQDYLFKVQSLQTAIDSARRECEDKSLGAAAKASIWNEIISKNASALALLDQGKEHEPLIEEAKAQAQSWLVKANEETPSTTPDETLAFAKSQAVNWSADGKKKLLQNVQTALTQQGHAPGSTAGKWDVATFQALLSWQKDERLPTTGVLDLPTLTRLGLHVMQEPSKPQTTIVKQTGGSSNSNSNRSNSSSSRSPSWEDVAKQKVLQSNGPPSLPFR